MSFFTPLEGSALLYSKGLFTEAKLFVHNGMLYVQKGKGFIRLLSHERTSDSSVNWRCIQGVHYREHQGLVLHNTNVAKAACEPRNTHGHLRASSSHHHSHRRY